MKERDKRERKARERHRRNPPPPTYGETINPILFFLRPGLLPQFVAEYFSRYEKKLHAKKDPPPSPIHTSQKAIKFTP